MRTLVVDDHSLFRDGLISLLEAADFEVVGEAGDGDEAVKTCRELKPDLVLLDIHMTGLPWLKVLQIIKNELPETKVVILTVSESDEDLFAAVRKGANGFLNKSLDGVQLLEMLAGLKFGEAAITRKTAARLLRGFANRQLPSYPAKKLTIREIELLQLVANGLSNKAIAQVLSVSENTVKYHLRNIFQKLNVQNRAEAVTIALREGFIR
jgi:DNA-binding NarL/FixJ family response regulator